MKGLQNGIPIAMLAAMASAQGLGGGPQVDTGNDVGLGFSNKFSNEVNNFNKDNHAVDVHSQTNVLKAPPHRPHGGEHGPANGGHDGHDEGARHQPRAGPASSDGVDVGSASELNYASEATHKVQSASVDDHHLDINEKHTITVLPPPPKHHPHGGEHEAHGEEHQGGHGQGEGARPHEKRWDPLDEGGAFDSGNSASFDFENEFYSKTNNANVDNHSLKVDDNTNIVTPPPHPHGHGGQGPEHDGGHGSEHERRDEHDADRPPQYVDTGNFVDFTFKNDFKNEVYNYNEDNHGVDVNKDTNVQVAPPHGGPPHGHDGEEGHRKRAYRPDADGTAGPGRVDTGNTANIQASNSVDTQTNSANVDDHSTKVHSNVDETIAAPPQAEDHEDGHEETGEHDQEEPSKPTEHHEQEPAQPVEHHEEQHAEPSPTCSTLTREVVHTVVRTVQAHSEPTHAPQHQEQVNTPAPQPEQPKDHEESGHDNQSNEVESPKPSGADSSHHDDPSHEDSHGPSSTPVHGQPQPTGVDGTHNQEEPSSHEDSHGPASTPVHGQPQPTGVDGTHNQEEPSSHEDSHGPASTPVHGQPQHAGDDGSDFDVPSSTTLAHIAMTPAPSHASSHQHAVLTSTQTISRSSLHMVPVYVPQASSSGVHAAETPAATPSANVPFGVDAEHSSHVANGPATPSPSSHEVMFQGAAASLSPSAGVISLACGVIGLLAYVL
ncbi:hypothetical protein BDV39DRAFT_176974 [Aspergillus sergii]|uniref:GPI anchored protein n=1 Tax=Aspergillus sergii TaxID=1034303 RepID=A0A5N6X0H5_9EURO|nr:hypothetical protein BDV39DRAFT_176974 [Aspergillus sergii]